MSRQSEMPVQTRHGLPFTDDIEGTLHQTAGRPNRHVQFETSYWVAKLPRAKACPSARLMGGWVMTQGARGRRTSARRGRHGQIHKSLHDASESGTVGEKGRGHRGRQRERTQVRYNKVPVFAQTFCRISYSVFLVRYHSKAAAQSMPFN